MNEKFSIAMSIVLAIFLPPLSVADSRGKDCINMGGTANLFHMSAENGIGAVTGTIDGVGYGQLTSEVKQVGEGKFEYTGLHYFLDKDGSHLYTHDDGALQRANDTDVSTFQTVYKVIDSSGRFVGMRGAFRSSGWVRCPNENNVSKCSVGVVRFEGEICRE